MLDSRNKLIEHISTYSTSWKEEALFIPSFLSLLKSNRCFERDHVPGHITGSAWIINEEKSKVVLIHHAKLHRWLQPGGHADGDENILRVALREAEEETGLTTLSLFKPGIFDLDIHRIPAHKGFPEHDHYDVRFAFVASEKIPLQISPESHHVQWIALTEVADFTNQNVSIARMIQKTISS